MPKRVRDFGIVTINDARADIKDRTRTALNGWTEHDLNSVNGQDKQELVAFFTENPWVKFTWHLRTGEAGYWGSIIRACQRIVELDVPVAVFEDDAEITSDFTSLVDEYTAECSDDIDAFQLFTWVDRANPRALPLTRDESNAACVVENWNEWPFGGAIIFPSGAEKYLRYFHENPIITTGDVAFADLGKTGAMRIMAPAPYQPSPITLNHGKVKSTIDGTRAVWSNVMPRAEKRRR
jgi:GR25 family glycosyltransferase involved in LPS biosynthesis